MELFVRVSPPFTGNRVVLQTSGEAMRQILDDYGGMPGAWCERCWDFWISGNISFPQSLPTLLMVTWVKNYVFFLFLLWHHLVKCSEAQKTCQRYFKKAHQWTPGGFIGQAGYLTSNSLKKTSSFMWLVSHDIVCILTEQEF